LSSLVSGLDPYSCTPLNFSASAPTHCAAAPRRQQRSEPNQLHCAFLKKLFTTAQPLPSAESYIVLHTELQVKIMFLLTQNQHSNTETAQIHFRTARFS